MSFAQVYYTSSTLGVRGSKGFQVHAATAGVPADTLKHIERICGYVPPLSAPPQPSVEQIEQLPVSLGYHRLPSGEALVGQSKYVGRDYSGRFGNFFAHTVVVPDPLRDLPGLLPIELWRSPTWSTTEANTTELPLLDGIAQGGRVDDRRISAFLSEGQRMSHLPAMLTAAIDALSTRRRIILVDSGENVALWIGAISRALPRRLSLQLTFNTYVKNPYQTDVLIAGTTTDSDFRFAPHEIATQYFVFDFEQGRYTRIEAPARFAVAYAAAAAQDTASNEAFLGFVDHVCPDVRVEDLEIAFLAHLAVRGSPPEPADLGGVLRWCAAKLRNLDEGQLAALAGAATRTKGPLEHTLAPLLALYGAALAAEPRTLSEAVAAVLVPWVFQDALPRLSAPQLEDVTRTFVSNPNTLRLASQHRHPWYKLLRDTSDASRACALLRFGHEMSLLQGMGPALRKLAEQTLGPALGQPEVQRCIVALKEDPDGASLFEGVAAFLAGQVGDRGVFTRLGPWLRDARVASVLEHHAREWRSTPLHYRLAAARCGTGPNDRCDALVELLSWTEEAMGAPPSNSELELAFGALWDQPPSLADTLALLTSFPAEQLAATSLPETFAKSLGSEAQIDHADDVADKVAALLSNDQFRAALGQGEAHVDAFVLRSKLVSDPLDGSSVERAASLPSSNPHAASLRKLGAERALLAADARTHVRLLQSLNDPSRAGFRKAYVHAVEQLKSRPPVLAPARLAVLFVAWQTMDQAHAKRSPGVPSMVAPYLLEVLPKLVAKSPAEALAEVEGHIEWQPEMTSRWRQWMEDTRPKGLFSRIRDWFSGGG